LGKFNVTFDCFSGRAVGTLIDNMQGNRTSRALGRVLGGVPENPDVTLLNIAPLHGGSAPAI